MRRADGGREGDGEVEIRAMRAADLDEVMRVEREAYKSPWARAVFEEELGRAWARVDVLRAPPGGTVRAFANYWLVRDEVHLLNVATHPEARRRGYAARLVQRVIDFARTEWCEVVTLEVRRSNVGAMRLYRGLGFRPVGVRPKYYAEDGEDAIVMLWERARE